MLTEKPALTWPDRTGLVVL